MQGGDRALAFVSPLSLLVLLMVCPTVSTLLAGGVVRRRRELGIQTALGGARWRIMGQILTESLLLAVGGAAIGALLLLLTWRLSSTAWPIHPAVDRGTTAILLLIVVVAGCVAGLAPALPGITITRATTLDAHQRDTCRTRLTTSGAAAAGGFIALLIVSVGLLATGALSVSERTREIGIRSALGATTRRLVLSFFWNGVRLQGVNSPPVPRDCDSASQHDGTARS